ncbi:MAG TPA: DUF3152 domain-containing protein [Actinomycetes bacterium]|nr:DUF3152 domain-containing protein [Actinomycetes bacterium]
MNTSGAPVRGNAVAAVALSRRPAIVAGLVAVLIALGALPGVPGAASAVGAAGWAPGDPTALTSTASPSVVATGRPTTFAGRLTDAATSAPLAGLPVDLEAQDATGGWTVVATLTTDADGQLTSSQVPPSTTVYRVHHGAAGSAEESVSPPVTVRVKVLTAAPSRLAVPVGRIVTVRGVLGGPGGRGVRLEQGDFNGWHSVAQTTSLADGSFAFSVEPTAPGFWTWRVVHDADAGGPEGTVWLPRVDAFRLHTYAVTTRGTVRADPTAFRALVAATYADPRGWLRAHHRFREVRHGGAFTVVLAQPRTMRSFSSTCSSAYSCRIGRYVVINAARWVHGSPYFTGSLLDYRQMVIDHETGHWLGLGHAYCRRTGALAPVMQQQSKGMQGCRPNPWPLPREIRAVRAH